MLCWPASDSTIAVPRVSLLSRRTTPAPFSLGSAGAALDSSRKWLHEKGRPACTDRLLDLAADVRRLSPPDHRDPDAFHIAKSGIADELRRVAHDAQQRLQD